MPSVVWCADRAPITWQHPPRGSRKWRTEYAKRSSVERGYPLLENPDLIQLKDKAIKLRKKTKFALMVALACAATNLHLARLLAERPAAPSGSPPTPQAA